MAFLAPIGAALGGAGAAGAGAAAAPLSMSAIGSAGGLASSELGSALAANPALAGITPSMVTGASAAAPSAAPGALSSLGSGAKNLLGGNNSLFNAMAPSLFQQKQPDPIQFPQLQHSQGQPVTPVGAPPSVGNAGPLNSGGMGGGGMSPQLMQLIQMLSRGGGM